jgi:L-2-hydroxyglutarate oxidase
MYDYAIVGGGIVGLTTAAALAYRFPSSRILVLEKEDLFAQHQTGRNSGVIHAGIYYKPGSLKARLSHDGNLSMRSFCERRGIPHEICGKIIVATEERELPLLEKLFQRGIENRISVARLSRDQVREHEPHVSCLAGFTYSQPASRITARSATQSSMIFVARELTYASVPNCCAALSLQTVMCLKLHQVNFRPGF